MIIITVTGTENNSKMIKALSEDFRKPIEPLELSSKQYLNVISTNFKDEGRTFGEAWAPLSPATIALKRELRKKGKSIGVTKPLLRTGKMRSGFGYDLKNSRLSSIYNTQSYVLLHQEGGSVDFHGRKVTVPRRVLAAVDNSRINMVANIFNDWINKKIKQYEK